MSSIEELSEICKIFSDPTRLKIIKLLNDHEFLCVNAITKKLDVSQSAVSQHLRVLRQAKLVNHNRKGYMIHYSLNKETFSRFTELFREEFE